MSSDEVQPIEFKPGTLKALRLLSEALQGEPGFGSGIPRWDLDRNVEPKLHRESGPCVPVCSPTRAERQLILAALDAVALNGLGNSLRLTGKKSPFERQADQLTDIAQVIFELGGVDAVPVPLLIGMLANQWPLPPQSRVVHCLGRATDTLISTKVGESKRSTDADSGKDCSENEECQEASAAGVINGVHWQVRRIYLRQKAVQPGSGNTATPDPTTLSALSELDL